MRVHGAYVVRRTLRALLTAFGVVALVFVLVRAAPGDPVDAMLGEGAQPADRALMRERLHLNESWPRQFLRFSGTVLDGSLGHSFRSGDAVSSLIAEVAGPTVRLAFSALLFALLLALPLGVLSASRRDGALDGAARLFAIAGLAIPNLWLGPMLLWLFAMKLRWLPLPAENATLSWVLPVVTLGTALAASLTRQTRAAVLGALAAPSTLAARARGLSRTRLLLNYGLLPAALPILTLAFAQLGALLAGAVVVEKIFERPGLGGLFLEAFFARDMPVIQGVVLLVALVYVALNLLLDLCYAWLDPRVEL